MINTVDVMFFQISKICIKQNNLERTFEKHLSCQIHNYILAVNHGISSPLLISSKIFNLPKGEKHI